MPGFIDRIRKVFFGTSRVAATGIPLHVGPGGGLQSVGLDAFVAGRQGPGTKVAAAYGHPDALLAPTEIQRLFTGEWIPVVSSWISAIRYEQATDSSGGMFVRLQRGKEYGPTYISPAEMAAVASAPSKGHTINKLWRRARGG